MYIPNSKTELDFDSIKPTACPKIVFSYTSAIPDANDFRSWIVDCAKLVAIFGQNNASIVKVDGSVPTLKLMKILLACMLALQARCWNLLVIGLQNTYHSL